MKTIRFFGILSLFTFMVACDTDSGTTETDPQVDSTGVSIKETPVDLETKTEEGMDGASRLEYQVDKNTGMKHGSYKEMDVEGQLLVERNYKQNKLDGIEKYYFENGKVEGEFNYVDGKHDGPFKYYFKNDGKVMQEGTYVDGKIEGVLKTYYQGGTLKEEVNHIAGVTQGVFKEYNENGTIKAEGEFTSKGDQENLETGLLKVYNENGEMNKRMVCKEGQCCTIWTLEDGDMQPSSKLCAAIVTGYEGSK